MFETILQQFLNGLTLGGIYALIALGYTMIYGIIKLINFAHGDIFMVGAFMGLAVVASFTSNFFVVIIVAMLFCSVLGFIVEKAAYLPLRETSVKSLVFTASVLALILVVAFVIKNSFIALVSSLTFWILIISYAAIMAMLICRKMGKTTGAPARINLMISVFTVLVLVFDIFVLMKTVGGFFGVVQSAAPALAIISSLILMACLYVAVKSKKAEAVKSEVTGGSSRINALISAIGMSFIISNMVAIINGPGRMTYPQILNLGNLRFGEIVISGVQIFIIAASFILMAILYYIVHKTKVGMSMRAVSQNMDAARLMGINPHRVIGFTFALGSSLAAAAGVLVGIFYTVAEPTMGGMYGLKAFVAAVLGGIGSIPGAVAGGLILGMAEMFGVAFIAPSYKDAIAFGILILILVIKPTGIFGSKIKEKV